MNRTLIATVIASLLIGVPAATFAQGVERNEAIASSDVLSQISMFSYREGPKSDLLFRGTPLAAGADGKAQVEYQDGNSEIKAQVNDLPVPSTLGAYTTYVLWALTPDGRAANQGVIGGAKGGRGEMNTQYNASQFALIVTAEPHYAVTVPSTMIVLYNVNDNVKGTESKVATLTERADYSRLSAIAIDGKTNPVELVQARYAVAIAAAAGAERYAMQDYAAASQKLSAAQSALTSDRKSDRETAPGLAREAVTAGEDARRAAMIGAAAANVETQRVASARAATDAANRNAAAAASVEAQRLTAARAATDTANRNAAADRQIASDRQAASEREAAADRQAASSAATAAASQAATAATAAASQAASAATAAATQATNAATAAAAQAATAAAETAAAKAERDELRNRLNTALPTRDTNRGLVANVPGVQFATGRSEMTATGREDIAKFSGIVSSYPGLRFAIEGHTDTTGTDATNQALSLRRARTVRDYLVAQGVPAANISVVGFGSSMPTDNNGTVDGRARNRRVEIIMSGEPIARNN